MDADQEELAANFANAHINTQPPTKEHSRRFSLTDADLALMGLVLSALAPSNSLMSFPHLNVRGTIDL
jgi:hypothetical protein